MSYIIAAWLASIIYGFGVIVAKLASKHHIANPWLYNFMWGVVATAILVPIGLVNGMGFPQDWGSMMVLSLANVLSGTAYVLAFYAVDVSVIGPLSNLRTPLIVLVGVFWFRELLTTTQWVLIGIIFLFGMLVNVEERFHVKTFFNRRMALVFIWIATVTWFNAYIKYASLYNGYWEVVVWPNLIGLIMMIPTLPLFVHDFRKTKVRQYSGLIVSAVLFLIGWGFEVYALRENVSITMTIISLPFSLLLAIGFSIVAPKLLEKHTPKVYAIRLVSAVIMFAAALGLSK